MSLTVSVSTILSLQLLRGRPFFLRSGVIHSNIFLGHLSSSILFTCPNQANCLLLISSICVRRVSFRILSSFDRLQLLLRKFIPVTNIFFLFVFVTFQASAHTVLHCTIHLCISFFVFLVIFVSHSKEFNVRVLYIDFVLYFVFTISLFI